MPDQPSLYRFVFDARPDTIDFRDQMYLPTLVEVPSYIPLDAYRSHQTPMLSQGNEGACIGFGLATVANYLLGKRQVAPDTVPVSPRMFYEMAKRYDEWAGENYQGSSARGAMKAWHKHGVCSADLWPYEPGQGIAPLTQAQLADAGQRPLGAYFRVNHKDLVSMHSALAEVGILFATAQAHKGWLLPGPDGLIPYEEGYATLGGHAFAIVAFDARGFWIQNSWGAAWGLGGFAQISYDDWLANSSDVWVARLGAPVSLRSASASGIASGLSQSNRQYSAAAYSYADLHPHIISLGSDGRLSGRGIFGSSPEGLTEIFQQDLPRQMQGWDRPRLLLYFPSGLVDEAGFVQRVAEYRAYFLKAQVYPLVFAWHSDLWSAITAVLQEAIRQRRPEGPLNSALDFMLDRLDDTLDPLARSLGGLALWNALQDAAWQAGALEQGGLRLALSGLAGWAAANPQAEIHLLAHSAGSLLLETFIPLLTTPGKIRSGRLRGAGGQGLPLHSCSLWAPALSMAAFKRACLPAIRAGRLQRLALYQLNERAEQDDHVAHIYNKSLLYLISNALEERRNTPLLGLEKCIGGEPELVQLFASKQAEWVVAPGGAIGDLFPASAAQHHGDFDDDDTTLRSTLGHILATSQGLPQFEHVHSEASLRSQRQALDTITG